MPTLAGKRTRVAMGGVLGVLMLVGLTGCGSSSSSSDKAVLGKNQTADVTIHIIDSLTKFDPDKVEIQLNKEESFTVLNKDTKVHNVTIPAFAIDMDVQPGQVITVKLPSVPQAPRDGFFLFYCKYHQAQGESGKITIAK